jgi:ribosomal RNA-processing protein 9
VWEVGDMAFVDTLYGHQEEVISVDCLEKERAVSCGTDKTCRLWKVAEESQLVFRGLNSSMDCLSMIDETKWIAGSQDG